MIKAVLVDDLPDALSALDELLKVYCPEVQVIGKEKNILDALKLINKHKPDLVFLDINMPGGSGFDLLELIQERTFQVIFTTADENHALKAIKEHPVDYLVKPIDPDELCAAVATYVRITQKEAAEEKSERKIRIASQNEIRMIDLKSILYLEAEGRYSKIYLEDGSCHLQTKNLGDFESDLSTQSEFFRIHRSFIVNIKHIKKIIREDGGYVEMGNGKKIEISKMKKERFLGVYTGKN